MRISDWSSDVCSSDLALVDLDRHRSLVVVGSGKRLRLLGRDRRVLLDQLGHLATERLDAERQRRDVEQRSEEHTSELQSLMRISYAVFCLKKKKKKKRKQTTKMRVTIEIKLKRTT